MFFIAPAIIAFAAVMLIMPSFIKTMHREGFVGKNMNDFQKSKVAELGGVVVLLGFSLGIISTIFIATYFELIQIDLTIMLAGFCTILLVAFIGAIDDIIGWKKGIRQWQHALFPIIAALPLMAIQITNPPIFLPLIGILPAEFILPFGITLSFGLIYSLIFVPIGVTGASNATNMLAGLNGLEAGLSALILITLGIIALINGKIEALIFCVTMGGALISFLKFNWFPAKILGGDSLTLMCGATIAIVSILGDMEKIGIALMALFFIELYIKSKTRFQGESFGVPTKNGLLLAPRKKQSITHYFMSIKKGTEEQVTTRLLTTQAIICIVVLTLVILNYYRIIAI